MKVKEEKEGKSCRNVGNGGEGIIEIGERKSVEKKIEEKIR